MRGLEMDTSAIVTMIVSLIVAVFGSTGFWAMLQNKRDKSDKILKEVDGLKVQVKTLDDKVTKLEDIVNENEAVACRNRIVSFADDIRMGLKHSKDNFDHILIDIDKYSSYCEEHKDFKNSITLISVEKVLEAYRNDDFI